MITGTVDELSTSNRGEDIRGYALLIWHWFWLIGLVVGVSGGLTFFLSRHMTPVYQASTTVLVREGLVTKSLDYSTVQASEQLTSTYAQMIDKEPALAEVIRQMDLPVTVADLREMITVEPVRDTQLFTVTVESTNPRQAAGIANKLVEVFIDQVAGIETNRFSQTKDSITQEMSDIESQITQLVEQQSLTASEVAKSQIESRISQYRETYAILLQSYEQVRLSETQTISSVSQVEPASVPTIPVRPNILKNTLLAAVVGLLASAGAILVRDALDDTIKTPEDVASQLKLPVLGMITHYEVEEDKVIAAAHPRSSVAEAYRTLRTNVQYASVDSPLRLLMVTSADPGDGKTTISTNLAVVLAQAGKKVALLDCDLRRPAIHQRMGLDNREGLSQLFFKPDLAVLNGSMRLTGVENLRAVTAGPLPPNPVELLGSRRMETILDTVQSEYDMAIIDTPPALTVADASVLAPAVDGVLLVIRPGHTKVATARFALEQLGRVNARILGVVLNNVELNGSRYGYRYYSHYYYYSDSANGAKVVKKEKKK